MFKFSFGETKEDGRVSQDNEKVSSAEPAAVEVHCDSRSPNLKETSHHFISLCNGDLTLRKSETEAPEHLSPTGADIIPSMYEGGFKLWECAVDLAEYLCKDGKDTLKGATVLELGAGHALPSIVAARCEAKSVFIHDYNKEVIEYVSHPNMLSNVPEVPVRYFCGSWRSVPDVVGQTFDIILSAETVYATPQVEALATCIMRLLRPGAVAYVAGKSYYFGVGGGMRQFEAEIRKVGNRLSMEVQIKTVLEIRDGVSNVRKILQIATSSDVDKKSLP